MSGETKEFIGEEMYDITLAEYIKLPKRTRNKIVSHYTDNMMSVIKIDPRALNIILFELDERLNNALDEELYEGCELITRLKEDLIKKYNNY